MTGDDISTSTSISMTGDSTVSFSANSLLRTMTVISFSGTGERSNSDVFQPNADGNCCEGSGESSMGGVPKMKSLPGIGRSSS